MQCSTIAVEHPSLPRYRVHAFCFRVGDGYRAVQRHCPHQNTDFSRGLIVGDGAMIRCGLHAYTFKLADGNGVNCPGYRIAVYDVMRDGSRLLGRRAAVDG